MEERVEEQGTEPEEWPLPSLDVLRELERRPPSWSEAGADADLAASPVAG